jgi:prepilin-type N-terminal cleavage/methylation domain-containing protein
MEQLTSRERKYRLETGFSLIELLVSMVLLSAIVLISSYSFSQFTRYWDGRLGNFDARFSQLRNVWLVEDILRNLQPYEVVNDEGLPRFYFEGNINGFVAVSAQSLSEVQTAAVVRLSLIQNDDMTFDLIYEDAPMKFEALTWLRQRPDFRQPVALLTNLKNATFEYFGPEPRRLDDVDFQPSDRWFGDYNSARIGSHPKKVRFNWSVDQEPMTWLVDLTQPSRGAGLRYGPLNSGRGDSEDMEPSRPGPEPTEPGPGEPRRNLPLPEERIDA